jgi:hypothetical protein
VHLRGALKLLRKYSRHTRPAPLELGLVEALREQFTFLVQRSSLTWASRGAFASTSATAAALRLQTSAAADVAAAADATAAFAFAVRWLLLMQRQP